MKYIYKNQQPEASMFVHMTESASEATTVLSENEAEKRSASPDISASIKMSILSILGDHSSQEQEQILQDLIGYFQEEDLCKDGEFIQRDGISTSVKEGIKSLLMESSPRKSTQVLQEIKQSL